MKYQIQTSHIAQADLNASASYLAFQLKNPVSAKQLLINTIKVIDSLDEFPARFPLVRDSFLANLGIRMVPIDQYLLFYQVEESRQTVHIIRFLYGKRNWTAILKSDFQHS